ncbi:hypothetical protein HHK36_024477 [Tetracentron sinense]|uniref:Nudix hydrolase domain-containing protein n=1 Tax=Tetracentron sinense TaxID=13715 RepID=A0A835D6R1_TETSI|nr:hypothetical protein HHK36_024477 [Tetracentron sinense]
MSSLGSPRMGRQLQRYNEKGCRQVVGCIPYRYKNGKQPLVEELEVLLVSSQKGLKKMFFPKGGWERDESIEEAASRETEEEAGVLGTVECQLGKWSFKSKSCDAFHEGYMFPLLVNKQLDLWPEKDVRQRKWMSVSEAREVCQDGWMKEALDGLVSRLMPVQSQEEEIAPCSLS